MVIPPTVADYGPYLTSEHKIALNYVIVPSDLKLSERSEKIGLSRIPALGRNENFLFFDFFRVDSCKFRKRGGSTEISWESHRKSQIGRIESYRLIVSLFQRLFNACDILLSD